MSTRRVALDEEAYELLKRSKKGSESFSEAVKRLARSRRPISDFGGMWSDMTQKERKTLDQASENMREADRRRADRIRRAWG
jgi:predicted CopG family antitoxin